MAARIRFDATASIVTLFIGYLGFVGFIARQGVRHLRIDTEVALAREIHETLVPRVAWRGNGVEVLGASFPAHEVGGDLVDAVPRGEGLTCYLADVSGHGVPAGTLMAALKSAARMRLLRRASVGELLSDLNEILFAIKRVRTARNGTTRPSCCCVSSTGPPRRLSIPASPVRHRSGWRTKWMPRAYAPMGWSS